MPLSKARSHPIRPLLKWAGGKRQLLPQLRPYYPREFGRYIEPFVGSGAVFFDLHATGRLRNHEATLIDSNADLIGCYTLVRDRAEDVARALGELAAAHQRAGRRHYYDIRDGRFNPLRDRRRSHGGRIRYDAELAAMFIYLNRTGFNGLFRLNSSGAFNVPVGKYEQPSIPDRAQILRVAEALSNPRVRLELGSFESSAAIAAAGDFLYIDPPYAPISRTASFTSYTAGRFDTSDQRRLHTLVVSLALRGCHVLLSNSTAAEIEALYDANGATRAAGLKARRVSARRAINSNGARRGPVDEYLITNIR
jgi:DNA adenine methylase